MGFTGVQGNIWLFSGEGLAGREGAGGFGDVATVMFLAVRMVRLSRGIKVSHYW